MSARRLSLTLSLALLVFLVAGLFACGGGTLATPPSAASAFVGTWSCSGNSNYAFTSPPDTPGTTSSVSPVEVFVASSSGALTGTAENGDGGLEDCAFAFSVSGSTATAAAGQKCSGGGFDLTLASETFTVSGSSATSAWSGTITEVGDAGVAFTATVTTTLACTLTSS